MNIKFGTDGWRAIIAENFTFENLRIVSQAIAAYVNNSNDPGEGIVIGYDQRFLSEEFAQAVTEVLAGNNIKVYLISKPSPTPVTAFAIKHWNCKGAVMLTASHNPPVYHGIKYIPYFAGPALPETTNIIEDNLSNLLSGKDEVKKISMDRLQEQNLLERIEPKELYINHLKNLIDCSSIKKRPVKIVIDPMYGAGVGYLEDFLSDTDNTVITMHNYRDPLFGGGMPEPKKDQLLQLRDRVLKEKADLGLALDGDADRFGIIDKNGDYINPNQVISLILFHLISRKGWKGPVARTVATTHTLDNMCCKTGDYVFETPVGFKYIGQALREKGCILGGEESGGMSIKGHIPEKDGILACLLILEIVCLTQDTLTNNLKELKQKCSCPDSNRLDLRVSPEKKQHILDKINNYKPKELLGKKVIEIVTIDGVKIKLEDGSWVLVRPSGTEPLFRIYAEASTCEGVSLLQNELKKILKA
jgi:alpha-D-glucose phosphate-specific phosphoglucomutase